LKPPTTPAPPEVPKRETRERDRRMGDGPAAATGEDGPFQAQVVGNRIRVLAGTTEVVNLEVVIQRRAESGWVTRRDLIAGGIGAGTVPFLQTVPFLLSPPKQTPNRTVAVPIRRDILPPNAAFLAALPRRPQKSPHSPEFVVYLAGFLLNYDPAWTLWWHEQKARVPFGFAPVYMSDPLKRAMYVKEQFGDLAAALREEVNYVRAKDLCEVLLRRHEGTSVAKHQLAILFALLDPVEQPKDLIARILAEDSEAGPAVNASSSLIARLGVSETIAATDRTLVRLPDRFSPPKLLPSKLYPVFETSGYQDSGRWVVPVVKDTPPPPTRADAPPLTPFGAQNLGREDTASQSIDFGFNLTTIVLLGLAGSLASSLTNGALHPLEAAKIRRQASVRSFRDVPAMVSNPLLDPVSIRVLFTGFWANVLGHGLYGFAVYPLFETGKLWLSGLVDIQDAVRYRLIFVLIASVVATVVGCFIATPFEAAKIRSVANPSYAPNAVAVVQRIAAEEGLRRLWSGYPPYVTRNVVFTIVKFTVFDFFWDAVTAVYPSIPLSESAVLVTLTKGAIAGILGACASQPLDVLLTQLAKSETKLNIVTAATELWAEQGPAGFFTGLRFRALAAAGVISLQFSVYGFIKAQMFQAMLGGLQ